MALYDIAALNEMAVQLVAEAKYAEGVQLLSRGLKLLDNCLEQSFTEDTSTAATTTLPQNMLWYTRLSPLDNLDQVSPGNLFDFVPYMFSVTTPSYSVHPRKLHAILASVMTCNLAMIYHQTGLASGSSRHVTMALKLYRQIVGFNLADDVASMLLLVVTSNLAQIQAHLLNWQKAQKWMKCALGIAAIIDEQLPSDILDGLAFHSISFEAVQAAAPAA